METELLKTTIGYKLFAVVFISSVKGSQLRNKDFAPSHFYM